MDMVKIDDAPTDLVVAPTQEEIEAAPRFEVWKKAKKQEAKDYVFAAFGLVVTLEDLVVWRDDAGWPDPLGRAGSHKIIVSNQKYKDDQGNTLGNYNVWRKLPMLVVEAPTEP